MGKIEDAVAWAIEIANDPRCGYSQSSRWGPPDFDCSSFVISAWEQAGVPLREAGASFTGNMRAAMIMCGFVDVTNLVGIDTGYGMQPGDVLLNYAAHTCMHVGGGSVANCRTDEGHPQSGDQGQEIRIQPYWNGDPNRWNCVLRYKGPAGGENVSELDTGTPAAPRSTLSKGMRGDDVRDLQNMLQDAGYSVGKAGADGIFGSDTLRAVASFQEDHGIPVTGIADPATIRKIDETAYPSHFDDGEGAGEDPGEGGGKFWLPDLQVGDKGDEVRLLQTALRIRGYDCGTPDGIFGPKTQAGLNKFRADRGMDPVGTADRKVWEKVLGVG